MALIKCPSCQKMMSDRATTCPKCGHAASGQAPSPSEDQPPPTGATSSPASRPTSGRVSAAPLRAASNQPLRKSTWVFVTSIGIALLAGWVVSLDIATLLGSAGFLAFVGFLAGSYFGYQWISRSSDTLSRLIARGCVLGAGLWFALLPISCVRVSVVAGSHSNGSDAERIGAGIGAGLGGFGLGALSMSMTLVCLVGYAVFRLLEKESASK